MEKIFGAIIFDVGPKATVITARGRMPWDEVRQYNDWRPGSPWEDIVYAWEAKKEDMYVVPSSQHLVIFVPALQQGYLELLLLISNRSLVEADHRRDDREYQ